MICKSLPGCFGIEISKIDLSSSLSNDEITNIKKLFQDFHLIVFKEQNLNDDDQLKFTEYFGELEEFPEADKTKESNKTYHVANVTVEGKHLKEEDDQVIFQKVNQRWHTDSSYRFIPSYASLLYGIEVLPDEARGGETEFVNMFKVYENLEDDLKTKLESLHMVHYYEYGRRMFPNLPPVSAFERENIPPVSHPIIRLHPDRNNKRSLFFTANAGNEIGGMKQEEGASLHSHLVDIVENSSFQYKHRWEKGDLVMWDNRCLLHRAIPYDMNKYRRVFRRTTVAGSTAIKGPFLNPENIRN
ncbi:MAG: 2,4-dichlorophenoxyacetate dioxygenase [Pelagibacterales bacterium]|nr:2,4-dichlorophenoxyacetate dioxygenase [Pelagibacterales bacterium]